MKEDMIMPNEELDLDQLEAVSGGRQLTAGEQEDLMSAKRKINSITVSNPHLLAQLNAYQREFDGLFDQYMNMSRQGELGSGEILFRDFLKSRASAGLYRLLYQ